MVVTLHLKAVMFASPNIISLSTVIVEGWALYPIDIVLSDVV